MNDPRDNDQADFIIRFPPPQPSDQTDDLHLLRLVAGAWIDKRIDEWFDSVWPGLIPPRKQHGNRRFPPEADGDFDVVSEHEIEEWRARLNKRFGIGRGKLRAQKNE